MRTCNRANRRESTIELLSAPAAGDSTEPWEGSGEREQLSRLYTCTVYFYCVLRFNSQQNKTIDMLLGSVNTLICNCTIFHLNFYSCTGALLCYTSFHLLILLHDRETIKNIKYVLGHLHNSTHFHINLDQLFLILTWIIHYLGLQHIYNHLWYHSSEPLRVRAGASCASSSLSESTPASWCQTSV